jgi:hypothetical protein
VVLISSCAMAETRAPEAVSPGPQPNPRQCRWVCPALLCFTSSVPSPLYARPHLCCSFPSARVMCALACSAQPPPIGGEQEFKSQSIRKVRVLQVRRKVDAPASPSQKHLTVARKIRPGETIKVRCYPSSLPPISSQPQPRLLSCTVPTPPHRLTFLHHTLPLAGPASPPSLPPPFPPRFSLMSSLPRKTLQ